MHNKQKGNLGELRVMQDLIKKDCCVFTEFGEYSKVDIIALWNSIPLKIQVKSRKTRNLDGVSVVFDTRQSSHHHEYKYSESDVDMFAFYIIDLDIIFYASSQEFLKSKTTMSFRVSSNNRRSNSNYVEDFTFERALRDYKPSIFNKFDVENIYENEIKSEKTFCKECDTVISSTATRCQTCHSKQKKSEQFKIDWPEVDVLIEMVDESNYSAVGRKLGVSDNAIRKHIKNYK